MTNIRLSLTRALLVFSLCFDVPLSLEASDLEDGRMAIGAGDYAKALRLLAPLAKKGDPNAQNAVGVLYLNGWGVNLDYSEALQWFRQAAAQGVPKAYFNLGQMYDQGRGVTRNYAEAAKWYRQSAEQGYPPGQSLLAAMYARGDGVRQDYAEAMKWYRRAADQGDALAQTRVGFMFVEGQGVPKDYVEAEKWFRKAASQGHPHGQYWLGRLYSEGWGVKKNIREAAQWYEMAAERDTPEAQHALGVLYATGGGDLKRDDVRAIMWLRRAATYGNEEAREFLSKQYKASPEEGPALTTVLQAMKVPPEQLAGAYLLISYHVALLGPAREGRFRVTLHTNIDGKAETISESNALVYLAGYEDRLRTYSQAIEQKGFKRLAGVYDTKVSRGCKQLGFSKGKTTIDQNGFRIRVTNGEYQGEVRHRGVIVTDALAIEHAMNPEVVLLGRSEGHEVRIEHAPSNCVVTLTKK